LKIKLHANCLRLFVERGTFFELAETSLKTVKLEIETLNWYIFILFFLCG